METCYNPTIPFGCPLQGGLRDNCSILVSGTPQDEERFEINLRCGQRDDDDIAFHFNPRFDQNQVVRNSLINGNWGSEERDGQFPFKMNRHFVLVIRVLPDKYTVTINGKHFCDYNHRVPFSLVSYMTIVRGVNVDRVSIYAGNNLVKNPCAEFGMDNWVVTKNGGNGFAVEEVGSGCEPLKGEKCWATSFGDCEKKQVIDLGYALDEEKPEITVSEWYGSRNDSSCKYWMVVRLLNSDMEELDRREFNKSLEASGDWFQVSESITDYPKGLRFVELTHGGCDSCYWKGHYGAKITCSRVTLDAGSSPSTDNE